MQAELRSINVDSNELNARRRGGAFISTALLTTWYALLSPGLQLEGMLDHRLGNGGHSWYHPTFAIVAASLVWSSIGATLMLSIVVVWRTVRRNFRPPTPAR